MNAPVEGPTLPASPARRSRRTLLLIALVTVAPVVVSYSAYYLLPRERQVNYGTLLVTAPVPEVAGTGIDGRPFQSSALHGRWVLAVAASGGCDDRCAQALYATRQARTIQGREQARVVRVLLLPPAGGLPQALRTEHPDLVVAQVAGEGIASWPAGGDAIYLLDPLGNFVLAFPRGPDIKGMARDLTRLLKASRIG